MNSLWTFELVPNIFSDLNSIGTRIAFLRAHHSKMFFQHKTHFLLDEFGLSVPVSAHFVPFGASWTWPSCWETSNNLWPLTHQTILLWDFITRWNNIHNTSSFNTKHQFKPLFYIWSLHLFILSCTTGHFCIKTSATGCVILWIWMAGQWAASLKHSFL